MLVTFSTPAYASITLFGDVAQQLLRMMGHSDTVPGALLPEDVPTALARLRAAVARADTDTPSAPASEDEEEPPVPLGHRALPLIDLLEAAAREESEVMWTQE